MKKVFVFVALFFAANLLLAQWEPDVRLTSDPGASNTSYNGAWCTAASGDTVHVVWYDDRDGNLEIYYKRSTDGGMAWGTDTRLTNAVLSSKEPSIAVSGLIVHVVWFDNRVGASNGEIYYKRSEDAGVNWGEDTRLTDASFFSESPSIAIFGSVLHVVWYDDRNNYGDYNIYYKRSTDGGLSWDPDTQLSNALPYCGYPCVAASGSVVHVVWEDQRNGNGDIYYNRSEDEGVTWGPETRLTNNPADSWDPCVSVSGSVVHVVWMDNRNGNFEIYYKRSTDGGISWGADTRLTNATGDSEYPNIAASGSNVHIVWQDMREVNQEIYYKQSTDGGITWAEDTRLTNASYPSQQPSLSVSGSVVHVVWFDNRDMNDEIYYKQNPTGNIPVGIGNDLIAGSGRQISIWPNPASNIIHINFNNFSTLPTGQAGERIFITIWNILGEELLNKLIQNGESSIDVSNLQNGLYFLGITTSNNQTVSTKLVIMK